MSIAYRIVFATAAVAIPSAALAHPAGDVGIVIESGRIVTGLLAEDESTFTPNVRVFGGEFGADLPNFTDEPGFFATSGTFAPGVQVGFNFLKAARRWDGTSFSAISAERVEFDFGPADAVATPLVDVLTPGIALVSELEGEWHHHMEQTLLAPASDGIYLIELELFTNQPGIEKSLPFWIVYNQNALETDHDAAIEYVEATYVPGPGITSAIAPLAALGLRRSRRR